MKTTREIRHGARAAFVACAAAFVLLALGAQAATAAPAATQRATSACWRTVINDWLDNNRVDHIYPIPCYTQAIQHLNAYPDVQQYSSAADDIHRALLAVLHGGGRSGSGGGELGGGGTPGSGGGGSAGGGSTGGGSPGTSGGSQTTPIQTIIGRPSDAQSIPLPVIVLAALALLLLLAGGGTWLLRRLQMRRMTPATEPAGAPRPRS